jgi:hypothetical protein
MRVFIENALLRLAVVYSRLNEKHIPWFSIWCPKAKGSSKTRDCLQISPSIYRVFQIKCQKLFAYFSAKEESLELKLVAKFHWCLNISKNIIEIEWGVVMHFKTSPISEFSKYTEINQNTLIKSNIFT